VNETRVRFVDDELTTTLLVESSRPGGMIAPLVSELTRVGLTVQHIESRQHAGQHVERVVVAEPYDVPFGAARVAELKAAVFGAVEKAQLGAQAA